MKRPHLVVHTVASADGRVSLGPGRTAFDDVGDPRWSAIWASDADLEQSRRDLVEEYRPDVLLEGSGSFAREDSALRPLPSPECDVSELTQDYLPENVVHRPGHIGWLACVDGRGRVRAGMKEFPGWEGWHTLHLVARTTPPEYLAFLRREEIPYLVAGEGHVNLVEVFQKLASLLAVQRVVSTAGSRLNGALLRAGLVDEFDLAVLPALIGGCSTPVLFGCSDLASSEPPTPLELREVTREASGRVRLRYRVDNAQA
ncbi:MAG: deaminase [Actinobacteria bacterium]|nr:deaminase [Actinomycetota bacterium]